MQQPHRQGASIAAAQIEIDLFRAHHLHRPHKGGEVGVGFNAAEFHHLTLAKRRTHLINRAVFFGTAAAVEHQHFG